MKVNTSSARPDFLLRRAGPKLFARHHSLVDVGLRNIVLTSCHQSPVLLLVAESWITFRTPVEAHALLRAARPPPKSPGTSYKTEKVHDKPT